MDGAGLQDEGSVPPIVAARRRLSPVLIQQSITAILQRVLSASVTVDNELVSSIGKGILVLAAVAPGDTEREVESMAKKILKLKLWDDESGGRVRCPVSFIGLPPRRALTNGSALGD